MRLSSTHLSYINLSTLLDRLLKLKAIRQAKQIHALLLTTGAINGPSSLDSKLLGLYACCGELRYAGLLFDRIPKPNIFALNWMVSAMAFHGHYEEAVWYFSLVYLLRNVPNKQTISVVLKACVGLLDLNKGKEVHSVANKMGLGSDVLVCNGLLDMYCKCGKIDYARKVFNTMPARDVVSWTAMIFGYCNVGKLEEALCLFQRMSLEGVEANDFTWNAIIAGHAQRGDYDGALGLFHRMTREGLAPDVITWNALISGFALSKDQGFRAVELLKDMLFAGIRPNSVTITGLLPACGLKGSTQRVREIHGVIYRYEVKINVYVAGALIDMYAKCGSVNYSRGVFEQIRDKNTVIWNSMISCYGRHGFVDLAIQLFEEMQIHGLKPNEMTLASVLSACSHGGLVVQGMEIFRCMKEKYGVSSSKEHYACVIDLLCRAGRMDEAYGLILKDLRTLENTDSILGAFYNGCKIHGRSDLAKEVVQGLLQMEMKKPDDFVSISNIYADDGDFSEVENVREIMKHQGVKKRPGFSFVERKGLESLDVATSCWPYRKAPKIITWPAGLQIALGCNFLQTAPAESPPLASVPMKQLQLPC